MNCNHRFHLEDLLSETEKAATILSIGSRNTGKTTQYWKLSHGLLNLLFTRA